MYRSRLSSARASAAASAACRRSDVAGCVLPRRAGDLPSARSDRSCSFGTGHGSILLSKCRQQRFAAASDPTVGRARRHERSGAAGMAAQAREFKAEPSSLAVMSTIGMTRS